MRLFLQFIIMTLLCSAQSINEQLKELEYAPPQQRVELMNHIKEQLILMNQEQRVETINKLRVKLQLQSQTQIKTHQREPMHRRDRIINIQQTDIEHQESKQHIINMRNHQMRNNIQTNHQEQPVFNQPNRQTNHQEQPVNNQLNRQTNHQEQPVNNQPNRQTNHQEQPVNNQQNTQQDEFRTNSSNTQSGRG